MFLLDNFESPSGRETGSGRPVWRVRNSAGQVTWAFVAQRPDGRYRLVGYPTGPVVLVGPQPDPGSGFVVGASAGAILGTAFGGPMGALFGGILGGVLGAVTGSRNPE